MSTFVHPALKAGSGVAVITGASLGGIGYAIASTLIHKHNFKVHLVDKVSLGDTAAALKEAGAGEGQFETHVVDVSRSEEVFGLAEKVYARDGRVDFLALNAGVQVPSKDWKEGGDLDSWHKTFDVSGLGAAGCDGQRVSGCGDGADAARLAGCHDRRSTSSAF